MVTVTVSPALWRFIDAGQVLLVANLLTVDRHDQIASHHHGNVADVGALVAALSAPPGRLRRPA